MKSQFRNTIFTLTIILLLVVPPLASSHPYPGRYATGELVCKPITGYTIDQINGRFGTSTKGNLPRLNSYLLQVPYAQNADSLAHAIDSSQLVEYCTPNYLLSIPEALQRSSPFVDMQLIGDYELQSAALALDLPTVYDLADGSDVQVAVLDGGVTFDHPEFLDADAGFISGGDYIDNDGVAYDEPGGSCSGHGTLVAGVIHLVAPAADVHVYRVLDTAGIGNGFAIAAALLRAVADGCTVVNMSFGMIDGHPALSEALAYARSQGVTLVAAAGNDSTNVPELMPFPASSQYCLSVTAVDSLNVKADFANFGDLVDICAPGTMIYGPFVGDSYAWWDGTSFAGPFVCGLAALMQSVQTGLRMEQVEVILNSTGRNIDGQNAAFAGQLGAGLIDVAGAVTAAKGVVHGDVNNDGFADPVDLSTLVDYFYNQPDSSVAEISIWSDCNCDGSIDPTDLAIMVDFFFSDTRVGCLGE